MNPEAPRSLPTHIQTETSKQLLVFLSSRLFLRSVLQPDGQFRPSFIGRVSCICIIYSCIKKKQKKKHPSLHILRLSLAAVCRGDAEHNLDNNAVTDRNGDNDNEEIMIRRDGNDCSMNSTTDNNTLFFTPTIIIIIIIMMMMMTHKSPPPPVIRRSLHPRCCSLEAEGQPVILPRVTEEILVPEYSKCRWSGF